MLEVTKDKSGNRLNVQVATTQEGWKFPADFPTRQQDGTTKRYYVIPVTYHLLEEADVPATTVAALKAKGIADPIAEMNAGLRLAFGDLAKEPYRVTKPKIDVNAVLGKILAEPALLAEYQAADDAAKQAIVQRIAASL